MLQYLDTDISNNLPSDSGFLYSKAYFIKLIADNRLEELAYHGTIRLYVKQQMNLFGTYFLVYKTVLFFLFLLSLFFDFVVVARIEEPNVYNWDFMTGLRVVAEVYILCFWFSNVITEVTEILEIMYRTRLYLLHKRSVREEERTRKEAEINYSYTNNTPNKSDNEIPSSTEDDDEPPEETCKLNSTEMRDVEWLIKARHLFANLFITRFLAEYFSDSFNWFDQGGLISLFITIILRGFSHPLQWLFMPITFLLNCMRMLKLFNVYYSFGTYIRILASVTFYELPPFLMFFTWTLFVFSGAFFVSLRLPTVWQCPNDTDCQLDMINNSTYSQGHDDTIWYTGLLGLRVLLEQGPVYDDNYIVRLPWLSAIIFLVFLFITSVVYLNLLIAQLTDRFVIRIYILKRFYNSLQIFFSGSIGFTYIFP